jgi:hypothetical protein
MDDYTFPGISGGISYTPTFSTDTGGYSSGGIGSVLGDLGSGIKGALTTAADLWGSYNRTELQMAQTKAAVDIAKIQANGAQQTALAQAQWQAQMARYGIFNTGADSFNSANITASLGNMQRTIMGQQDPMQRLMLWLTVAGLALAFMQYKKG